MIPILKITGHRIEITDGIRLFLTERLGRITNLLLDATQVSVHLTGKKKKGTLSIQIRAYFKGKVIEVKKTMSSQIEDFYAIMGSAHALLRKRLVASLRKPVRGVTLKRVMA